jgi:hypothetical protein
MISIDIQPTRLHYIKQEYFDYLIIKFPQLEKQNLKEKKKNRCLYGVEKRQVYHNLMKTWQDYYNLSKEQVPDKKKNQAL